MKPETKMDLMILGIPVLVMLVLVLISEVRFGESLSPQERALVDFRSETVPQMVQRKPSAVGLFASPIPLVMASEKDYPPELLAEIATAESGTPQGERALSVSLIVVGQGRKLAIISGILAKEGDIIDRQRVVRIERDKVLIRDKEGERWLRLD